MKNYFLSSLAGLLTLTALFVAPTTAHAKVWRVDNNAGVPANFTTAQAAHDAASVAAGDTLYFNGSATSYGSLSLTKKLTIIGPGYFLDENPQTQVSLRTALISQFHFNSGSSGSMVTGMQTNGAEIYSNNITFRRNLIDGGSSYFRIYVGSSVSGIFINDNFMYGYSYYDYLINVAANASNVFISNNYIALSSQSVIVCDASATVHIFQNVINGNINTTASFIYNNIMLGGTVAGAGNAYNNNLCDATQFPTGNGNQQNVTMTNVFVTSGTSDGGYALKTGSPAIGAGVNGENCGMYGGSDPYVLSGLPNIPSIWEATQPSVVPASGTLQIRIKAKSHN